MIRDLLGREILNPYPMFEQYRIDPVLFFLTIKEDWKDFDLTPQMFKNCLETEFLMKPEQPYVEEAYAGIDWTLAYNTFYLPLPNMPYLIHLKCIKEYNSTIYIKAENTDSSAILYMEQPSISPEENGFHAIEILDINVKWKERLTLSRRVESRKAIHRKPETKPYGETTALYKCIPGMTYLLQDCYWAETTNNWMPDIKANKQLLVMSDLIFEEQMKQNYT